MELQNIKDLIIKDYEYEKEKVEYGREGSCTLCYHTIRRNTLEEILKLIEAETIK